MSKNNIDSLLDSEKKELEGRFNLNHHGECPVCHSSWDGGSILETFIKQREEGVKVWEGKSDEEIREDIEGWSYEKVMKLIDNISDEDLKSAIEKTMSKSYNAFWVRRYAHGYHSDMLPEDRRIFVREMHKDGLHTLLYENFGVYIRGSYPPPYRWSRLLPAAG